MQDRVDLRAFLGHVARDMDELYRSLSHQESHDKTRHDAMVSDLACVTHVGSLRAVEPVIQFVLALFPSQGGAGYSTVKPFCSL